MDAITLLDILENELVDSKGYIRRKADLNRCFDLVEEIKNSLPNCITEAQRIISAKQKILQNADTVAQNTIATAEQKAQKIVSDSEIGLMAQMEAQKIINKAAIQKDVLIDKTKTHLDSMFAETEQYLVSLIELVRKNRRELKMMVFN